MLASVNISLRDYVNPKGADVGEKQGTGLWLMNQYRQRCDMAAHGQRPETSVCFFELMRQQAVLTEAVNGKYY